MNLKVCASLTLVCCSCQRLTPFLGLGQTDLLEQEKPTLTSKWSLKTHDTDYFFWYLISTLEMKSFK